MAHHILTWPRPLRPRTAGCRPPVRLQPVVAGKPGHPPRPAMRHAAAAQLRRLVTFPSVSSYVVPMSSVPILINCRDRLRSLAQLVDYLERAGQDRIYLVDNDSTYPQLLEYFDRSPHQVISLGRNAGRLSAWESNLFDELGIKGRFVFTDPDIVPDEDCPLDAIEYFGEILDMYPERDKAGFGLRIDDIPDEYKFKQQVVTWESQFWERRLGPRLYDASIDTTFALYRRPAPQHVDRAVRTGFPYVARHTPWYLDDRSLPEDEAFFRGRSEGEDVNNWGRETLVPSLAAAIAAREAPARAGTRMDLGDAAALAGSALLDASGWVVEPEPHDETLNTPWADAGWHSWNDMSPEVELCDLIVSLVVATRPNRIIETGTGQGFLTRRVAAVLAGDQQLTCFESDPTWRQALASLPFFDGQRCAISMDNSPAAGEFATADLTYLDSDFGYRLREIERWWHAAAEGAVVFVHDAGNGHGPATPHATVRAKIVELAIPGSFLANPRGAFIGVKPGRRGGIAHTGELQARVRAAEDELRALQATRTFRYSRPARYLWSLVAGQRPQRRSESDAATADPDFVIGNVAGLPAAQREHAELVEPRGVDALADIRALLTRVRSPTVFDVGANVGQSVTTFRQLLPDSVIHSFEPGPVAFRQLEANTRGVERLHLVNAAVGANSGNELAARERPLRHELDSSPRRGVGVDRQRDTRHDDDSRRLLRRHGRHGRSAQDRHAGL